MELASTTTVDDRRLIEIDEVMRPVNLATAVAVALATPIFAPRYGLGFAAFALLPISWWALRALGLARRIGLHVWNAGLVAVITVAIAGGATLSGGVASPIVFLAGLTALFAQAVFPNRPVWAGLGLLVVTFVVTVDLARGTDIVAMDLVLAALLAAYLPLITRLLVAVEQIHRRRSVLDPLTGCLNRRSLETRALELDEQSRRTALPISLISFDIDHFKAVNDRHGHAAGDRVLADVAYIARKQVRRFELLYRLGGEEFVIILPGVDLAAATKVATRLRVAIADSDSGGVAVTVSVGVSHAEAPVSIEALLAAADHQMYRAKDNGRNCVATPAFQDVLRHDAALPRYEAPRVL